MINNKDQKRFDRFYQKYLKNWMQHRDSIIPDWTIQSIIKYGNRSSIVRCKNDWGYRNIPRECREILLKINVVNHFLNTIHFAQEIIINSDIGRHKNDKFNHFDVTVHEILTILIFFTVATISDVRKKYRNNEDRGKFAAYLIREAAIHKDLAGGTKADEKLAKLAIFANKKAYKYAERSYNKSHRNFNPLIDTNPAFTIHLSNQKAREFELRFYPDLQTIYKENES